MTCIDSDSDATAPGYALECDVVRTWEDVADCWHLAYRVYFEKRLISPNPYELFTSREALTTNSAVISGRANGIPVCTATAMIDGPGELPLDSVFHIELEALRANEHRLMEIGLVAADQTGALPDALRFGIQYGRDAGCTDVVCGIHPRRERLYRQLFALEPVGHVWPYPKFRNHPVRLMHRDLTTALSTSEKARLAPFFKQPIPSSVFERRFRLDPQALSRSPLAEFVRFVLR
jgi:hypothetical protein